MTATQLARPGEWFEHAMGLADIDFSQYRMDVTTDRYRDPDYVDRESDNIWMRVWQVVGRASELANAGDWREYRLLDQSFIIVRGKDKKIRGFVNACRHRGNVLCRGRGNSKRFLCQYHLWTYDLDGTLRGVQRAKENAVTPLEKEGMGLLEVPVDCFAGFIFLNPDPNAVSLSEFLGREVIEVIDPYHLDQMVTVIDVREALDCNWKVVMDAFEEGYHVAGIHPQLLRAITTDPAKSRYRFFGDHIVWCDPFEARQHSLEDQIDGILELPETFPGVAAVLPKFEELVAEHRDSEGNLQFPDEVTPRTLLQAATRATFTEMGFDVDNLTDAQMTDNNFWVLFPNFFMTVRAGEATIIMAQPHESGDPNKCYWQIYSVRWVPEGQRDAITAEPLEVTEPGSYKYFLALQQDYEQMPRQQIGLRNKKLRSLSLVKEEAVVAHFHSVVDRYVAGAAR